MDCNGSIASASDRFPRLDRIATLGHHLLFEVADRTSGTDWLPTFEFGLPNDSSSKAAGDSFSGGGPVYPET